MIDPFRVSYWFSGDFDLAIFCALFFSVVSVLFMLLVLWNSTNICLTRRPHCCCEVPLRSGGWHEHRANCKLWYFFLWRHCYLVAFTLIFILTASICYSRLYHFQYCETALILASKRGHTATLKLLLQYGAAESAKKVEVKINNKCMFTSTIAQLYNKTCNTRHFCVLLCVLCAIKGWLSALSCLNERLSGNCETPPSSRRWQGFYQTSGLYD